MYIITVREKVGYKDIKIEALRKQNVKFYSSLISSFGMKRSG